MKNLSITAAVSIILLMIAVSDKFYYVPDGAYFYSSTVEFIAYITTIIIMCYLALSIVRDYWEQ